MKKLKAITIAVAMAGLTITATTQADNTASTNFNIEGSAANIYAYPASDSDCDVTKAACGVNAGKPLVQRYMRICNSPDGSNCGLWSSQTIDDVTNYNVGDVITMQVSEGWLEQYARDYPWKGLPRPVDASMCSKGVIKKGSACESYLNDNMLRTMPEDKDSKPQQYLSLKLIAKPKAGLKDSVTMTKVWSHDPFKYEGSKYKSNLENVYTVFQANDIFWPDNGVELNIVPKPIMAANIPTLDGKPIIKILDESGKEKPDQPVPPLTSYQGWFFTSAAQGGSGIALLECPKNAEGRDAPWQSTCKHPVTIINKKMDGFIKTSDNSLYTVPGTDAVGLGSCTWHPYSNNPQELTDAWYLTDSSCAASFDLVANMLPQN